MNQYLRNSFVDGMNEIYGVNENLAQYLFERWKISSKYVVSEIPSFIKSDEVKRIFLLKPGINRAKNYTIKQLNALGLDFTETIDSEKRIFKDGKYGFHFQEKFNGMADSFTGLYELIEPLPSDNHLTQNP